MYCRYMCVFTRPLKHASTLPPMGMAFGASLNSPTVILWGPHWLTASGDLQAVLQNSRSEFPQTAGLVFRRSTIHWVPKIAWYRFASDSYCTIVNIVLILFSMALQCTEFLLQELVLNSVQVHWKQTCGWYTCWAAEVIVSFPMASELI